MRFALLIAAAAMAIASCSASGASDASGSGVADVTTTRLEPVTTTSANATIAQAVVVDVTTTAAATSATSTTSTTSLAATVPETVPETSTAQPVQPTPPSTVADTVATVPPATTSNPDGTPYGMPIEPGINVGYAREHHDYPASDIFAGDCGTTVVSPVSGTLLEVRRENLWSADTDNPATRGGKSLSLLGDDGVRYYFAHFDQIEGGIAPGGTVAIGDHLGQIGRTGRAGACHLHFALSPPCPGKEWSVRRGVVWPWPYLDAWQRGEQLSPADEVAEWVRDHPDACVEAMADPHAADS